MLELLRELINSSICCGFSVSQIQLLEEPNKVGVEQFEERFLLEVGNLIETHKVLNSEEAGIVKVIVSSIVQQGY